MIEVIIILVLKFACNLQVENATRALGNCMLAYVSGLVFSTSDVNMELLVT